MSKASDCKNCPDAEAAAGWSGCTRILYMGGPAHAQYLVMRQLIPPRNPNVVTKHGWPSIRDDGCIVYSEGETPPTPEGFEAVEPKVFRPRWPFCPYRVLRVRLQDTGLLNIEATCCNPLTDNIKLAKLALADCQHCTGRPAERPTGKTTSRTGYATSRRGPPAKSST
jgi:hypothetical protein